MDSTNQFCNVKHSHSKALVFKLNYGKFMSWEIQNLCIELNIMRMVENRHGNFAITINKTTTTENRVIGTDTETQYS